MRYLRMFTNAVAGGVLMSMYLAVIVFQLNPQLSLFSMTAVRWVGAVLALYSPYFVVALYFLILGRDLVASRPLRPAWLSVRLLAWLAAIAAAAAGTNMWANLDTFDQVMSEPARDRMRDGAWATSVAAAVLIAFAILRYSFGRRGSRTVGTLLVVTIVVSVGAPMYLRGPGEAQVPLPPPRTEQRPLIAPGRLAPRVRVMALDGASLGFVRQRVAAGQLPNFGRLIDRGAAIDLATLTPTQAEPIWVAASTGKSPQKTGVRSSWLYRTSAADTDAVDILPDHCFAYALVNQGFVQRADLTADAVRSRTVWDILGDYGLASGIVGWPMTYPARAERGFIVSDRFDEAASSPLRSGDAGASDPTTAADIAREVFDDWQARPWHEVMPGLPASAPEPTGLSRARWDRAYNDVAIELAQEFAPRLIAVRYEGVGAFGHLYLREAEPDLFGDFRRASPQSVLDQYYAYIDGEIGAAIRRLAPGDLLLVVSGFGMEPTPLGKRLLARLLGSPNLTGTHEPAPDGFLLAYGSNVADGQFPRGGVADLAPTILYYMGIGVGRDMDGFARTDLFDATYVLEHPVKYVATHER